MIRKVIISYLLLLEAFISWKTNNLIEESEKVKLKFFELLNVPIEVYFLINKHFAFW